MSDNNDNDSGFVDGIVEEDAKIREEMAGTHESGEILKLLIKRLELYTEALKLPLLNKYTKIMLSSMKSDVVNEVEVFKTRKDFEYQISQIITRLDTIETDTKMIKDKLNIDKT